MKKILIAVKSCLRDRDAGFHQAIRDTWGKDFEGMADVRFFMGEYTRDRLKDEVCLFVDDTYEDLPFKTQAICEWMYHSWYTHVFLCDNDTFVKPTALLASGFENHSYSGYFNLGTKGPFSYTDERGNLIEKCWPWASGGTGYFLSDWAANIVKSSSPLSWAEDLSVGQILGPLVAQSIANLDIRDKATWHIFKTAKYPVTTPDVIREFAKYDDPKDFYKENR